MIVEKTKNITIFLLFCVMGLSACGDNKSEQLPTFTQMNELLAKNNHLCKDSLLTVANDLMTNKDHFLQLERLPISATDNHSMPLVVSGVLLYKDRPSHVRFDANVFDNQCLVSYQLNYHFDIPCMVVREEAFKKWRQIGETSLKTRYYSHQRHPNRRAYLTNLNRDVQCLVSVKDQKAFSLTENSDKDGDKNTK